jgi:hypothetical protein
MTSEKNKEIQTAQFYSYHQIYFCGDNIFAFRTNGQQPRMLLGVGDLPPVCGSSEEGDKAETSKIRKE